MTMFDLAAVLLAVAAVLAYVNFRTLRLPSTIAMLIAGLLGAVAITIFDRLDPAAGIGAHVQRLLGDVDFQDLRESLGSVLSLASAGVVISTALVGIGSFYLFGLSGVAVPFLYCLIFGALISPTDPVAVLAILNDLHVPKKLQINFTGESLLNDGVGVVIYTVLLAIASAGTVSTFTVVTLFAQEVIGGIALGIVGGFLVYLAAKSIDEPNIEVQLSVALVTALIAAAAHLHVSGPLACVVAGIFIGNRARHNAMRDETTAALDRIWSFADHVMNAILFLLLGLEAAAFHLASVRHFLFLGAIVVLVIAARLVSVAIPLSILSRLQAMPRGMIRILTWGGLRGGISVALALSLPLFPGREAVLNATYAVVVFTIIIQGLTIGHVIRRIGTDVPVPG